MHPELFGFLPTYGVLVTVAAIMGVAVVRSLSRRMGLDPELVTDMALLVVPASFLLSRVVDVVVGWRHYLTSWGGVVEALRFWEGGFTYLGGVGAGLFILYLYRRRVALPRLVDAAAPSLAMAHAIGRLGCLFAGCCWGKRWEHGIVLSSHSVAFRYFLSTGDATPAMAGWGPVHPTQLYEALGNAIIALALLGLGTRKRFWGELGAWYFVMYGILRFVVEVFRGDPQRGYVVVLYTPHLARMLGFGRYSRLFLSTSQALALVMVVVGIVWLHLGRVRAQFFMPCNIDHNHQK